MTVEIVWINRRPAKVCPGCKKTKPLTEFAQDLSKSDSRTSYCKECRNVYKRIRRSILPYGWRSYRNPEADKARAVIARMLKLHLIERPSTCEACKRECKPDGHHRDYSKPYDVVWLCNDCHAFVHSKAFTDFGKED